MKYFVSIIIWFNATMVLVGQVDTLKIKFQLPTSMELYAHKEFWHKVNYCDQDLRNSSIIETLDEENLFSVIYYYNRFGYPDSKRYGQDAQIVKGVWGHVRCSKIKEYTFSLILAAYDAGDIPESAFREYYLRQLCQLRNDRNEYKFLPIDSLYAVLGLKKRNHISIDTVYSLLSEFKQIRSDTNFILGRWMAVQPQDTIYFNGKSLIKKGKSQEVKLYCTANGKYYLLTEGFANAHEPVELIPLNSELTKFKIMGKESTRYYLISEQKDLCYTDDNHILYKSYTASR